MEFALATVTVVSLLMTLTMGVVTWRLVREERRRAAARLAVLGAELRAHGLAEPVTEGPPPAPPPDTTPPAETEVAPGALFSTATPSTSTPSTRLAAVGVASAVVAAFIVLIGVGFTGDEPVASARPAGPRPPVELLSLTHVAEGPTLAINGAVRNPVDAMPATALAVVATAFDDTGTLLAQTTAPVALDVLPPGVDSAFLIEIPAAGVSRYRISFLLDEVTVPHVDRRTPAAPGASGDPS